MSPAKPILLLGTHNRGKVVEISQILGELDFQFQTLDDCGPVQAVAETGDSYEANAVLKATGYAQQCGLWTLADDSGLEVDLLNGAPGVLSARHGGAGASDRDRIELLLKQVANAGASMSTPARFVSVVALADPQGAVTKVEYGVCEGTIIDPPRGANGFGYDPIFVPTGFNRTFAELPSATKDIISHRAKALRAMETTLAQLLNRT